MVKRVQLEEAQPSGCNVRYAATPNGLLTAEEVAEQVGLSVETLAQWRSQKKGIPYVKISRNCVRYRQRDLDGWVVERIVRTDEASDRR